MSLFGTRPTGYPGANPLGQAIDVMDASRAAALQRDMETAARVYGPAVSRFIEQTPRGGVASSITPGRFAVAREEERPLSAKHFLPMRDYAYWQQQVEGGHRPSMADTAFAALDVASAPVEAAGLGFLSGGALRRLPFVKALAEREGDRLAGSVVRDFSDETGSLFGTKKRYLFHGRGKRGAVPVARGGANLKHGGMEIQTPNTSYTWDPAIAGGFMNREHPEGLSYYQIKNPERVRNMAPDEYLEAKLYHQSESPGGISGSVNDPRRTSADDPNYPVRGLEGDVNLISYPRGPAGNPITGFYDEREIAAARGISPLRQSEIEEQYRYDPSSRATQEAVEQYHDPVLTRAKVDQDIGHAAAREYLRKNEADTVVGQQAQGFGPDLQNPVEDRTFFRDVRLAMDGMNAMNIDWDKLAQRYETRWEAQGGDFAEAALSMRGFAQARDWFRDEKAKFRDMFEDPNNTSGITLQDRKDLRQAHGRMMLEWVNLRATMDRVQSVGSRRVDQNSPSVLRAFEKRPEYDD